MTRDTAVQILRTFLCLETQPPETIPDDPTLKAALACIVEASDYQIFGICADHVDQATRVLTQYLQALGYESGDQIIPPFGDDLKHETGIYLKYNAQRQKGHIDRYEGQHRGVLVSCQSANDQDINETFGHLPLELFS